MKWGLALRLGRMPYAPAWELQRRLHELRRAQKIPDILISLEHEPVITLGRSAQDQDLLLSKEELVKRGVEVFSVERGGGATYHGPGQLVLYPIVDLRALNFSVRQYVWALEEVMIRVGEAFGVELFRRPGFPGVWHTLGKVGFLGIYVRNWVTMHGLALNVALNPNGFAWIVPCGISDLSVISLSDILGQAVSVEEAENSALSAFSEVFSRELVKISGTEVKAWLSRHGLEWRSA